jgi:hypothetical protein
VRGHGAPPAACGTTEIWLFGGGNRETLINPLSAACHQQAVLYVWGHCSHRRPSAFGLARTAL